MEFRANLEGWDELREKIIVKHGVPMMQRVADACNLELVLSAMRRGMVRGKARTSAQARAENVLAIGKGYQVSVEGEPGEALKLRSYRATVITASAAAMRHNARRNTMLRNLNRARDWGM